MNDIQSRLDAIFKRDDIRGIWPEPLSASLCALAAEGFAAMLRQHSSSPEKKMAIAVGYDARLSSPELSEAVLARLNALDCTEGISIGQCSSEELAYACGCHGDEFAGGIMITASHNPAQYNGMKFVLAGGFPLTSEQLGFIRSFIADHAAVPAVHSLKKEFADHLLSISGWRAAPPATSTITVVVSAGNGVGALSFKPIADQLEELGFCFVYLDAEPDGAFPHGVPNPLLKPTMDRLGQCVREHSAAMGVAFDGDADRAGFVDEQGQEIIPAQVYAIVALNKLRQHPCGSPKPVLMRNLCCSQLLADLFRNTATVVDTPVGHGQIKQLMRHSAYASKVLFAGEHSGHFFYPEFFSFDSGMLTALAMLRYLLGVREQHQHLSDILRPWREKYCWSGELNYNLSDREALLRALKECAEQYEHQPQNRRMEIRPDAELGGLQRAFEAVSAYDPAALRFLDMKIVHRNDDGASGWWFVLRPSGNEPKLRLNVEAWGDNNREHCQAITDAVQAIILKYGVRA